jgi:hypothetical protein
MIIYHGSENIIEKPRCKGSREGAYTIFRG